ncbi:MAG: nitrilase-related carbon-nitrogen hydrolase [Promethearchaeota archaeon]
MTLDQVRTSILKRQYDQALQLISNLPENEKIKGQTYKGIILSKQNDFTSALATIDEILTREGLSAAQEFVARVGKILILLRMKNYPAAHSEVDQSEKLLSQLTKTQRTDVTRWKGHLFSAKATFEIIEGNQDKAIDCYVRSASLFEEVDDKYDHLMQVINISWLYRAQGLLDKSLEYSSQQFEISKELGEKRYIGWSNFNIAMIYFYKGILDQAAHYAAKAEQIFEELGHQEGLSFSHATIASVYRSKGEFEKALFYYNRVLLSYEEIAKTTQPLPHCYCLSLRDIGSIYLYQDRLDEAINILQKALTIHKSRCKMRNTVMDYEIMISNLYSIYAQIEKGDTDQVERNLSDIRQTAQQYPWLDVAAKAAEAFILQNQPRGKDKARAQALYEEILDAKFDYELELLIQVNLSDLLLDELRMYGEPAVLEELQTVMRRISETANKQRSITSLIFLYLLQARLAVIDGDADRAKEFLARADIIAKEKGLVHFTKKIQKANQQLNDQLKEWKTLFVQNSSIQEQIELLNLKEFITEAVTSALEKRFETAKKFLLVYEDFLKPKNKIPVETCRVGIAQIGISQSGNLLEEIYEQKAPGIFGIKKQRVETVKKCVIKLVEEAVAKGVNILLFPELSIDLNYQTLQQTLQDLVSQHNMYIIPGSYHDPKLARNVSLVLSPQGILWEQEKHIPATIHFEGNKIEEGINVDTLPHQITIADTEYGRIAIVICRDFLDLDLRVELKNSEPPIDIILNPAFTPVTADFQAAHFDARRSIYAYCFFANIAEFGNSFIYTPERERTEYEIPAKHEGLTYKDIDLFKLRAERRRWEQKQAKTRPFIQSTRS